jgi:4'-phosphopantetheinyl transferase
VCGGAHGKPFVASALALEFNVSRSHELGVVAVSGRPVGIDIEWLGRDLDVDLLAPDVLSPREIRALERSGHAARTQFFFRRWTAKEAALKAVGAGLTVPLTDVVIADRAGEVTFRLRQEDARPLVLVLKEIELNDKDYVVAVATHSPPPRVQLRSWPSDL